MKYIMLTLASVVMLSAATMAQTKSKFGHINSQELLQAMPEKVGADKALEEFAKTLESQLEAMAGELESKIQDYRANESVMSDIIKGTKAEEIQNLEQRIQAFQQNAQQSLGKKEMEVYQPVLDKAKAAIEKVSSANGYSYVFDSSSGMLLHQPESEDLMSLVKKELGITE
ncbi:MAG: OmpH family outer membrane protein [Flavobacteriales bacterium]|nr:OmpH family outer membrane protein [Flavobacteriales bacterium]NCG29224.1 OmpH family outer membrane protein [Bacteroidota bacterium]MBT3964461.1 OmpH family outer membrane protein [Flavobacteriales bacterium]MBT4706175.1 OmpH family outer membrane protein [Flavobacteriales bacterium]MBT4931360.1 OmpH family outer membrane protein [Flavobacteriales bacterium]